MTLNTEEKIFIDELCRDILLVYIQNSKNKNNCNLKHYVSEIMSYEDVVLKTGKLLFCNNIIKEDAEADFRLQQTESNLGTVLNLSASIIAGGGTATAAKTLGLGAIGTAAAGIAGTTIAGAGAGLLSRVIMYWLRKKMNRNRKMCEQKFTKNDPAWKEKVEICTNVSSDNEYRQQISKLNSEVSKCDQTISPEKCKTAIYGQIAKLKDAQVNLQGRLIKNRQRLQVKMGNVRKKKISFSSGAEQYGGGYNSYGVDNII